MVFLNDQFSKEVNNKVFTQILSPNLADPDGTHTYENMDSRGHNIGVIGAKHFYTESAYTSGNPYCKKLKPNPYQYWMPNNDPESDRGDFASLRNEIMTHVPMFGGFRIVTEKYLQTLNKIYVKLWNESFTEDVFYETLEYTAVLAGLYNNHTSTKLNDSDPANPVIEYESKSSALSNIEFERVVNAMIQTGILDEADRIGYQDYFILPAIDRNNFTFSVEADKITVSLVNPMEMVYEIDATAGKYLNGKKLSLLYTPLHMQERELRSDISNSNNIVMQWYHRYENSSYYTNRLMQRAPFRFFKAKNIPATSKYENGNMAMGTHYIFEMGNLEDKQLAELELRAGPDIVFDHVDRISSIDNFDLAPSTTSTVTVS